MTSCATLFSKKQTVTVTSDVDGAAVYKGNKYVGTTPLTFETKSAKSTITVVKSGYAPQTINADVAIRWNTLWNWFNCWTGWLVDIGVGSTQKYEKTDYFVSLKDPSINARHNQIYRHEYNTIPSDQMAQILVQSVAAGATTYQAANAEKKQREAALKEQQRAEQAARVAQNKEKYAQFQAMTNRKASSSNYQSNQSYTTQGSYNDLLTSDPNWNTQVRMWVQQYGVERTREIVRQKRNNDYQQSIQNNKTYSQSQIGTERIISAVTSNRVQVKIKVRGNVIVAYSNGLDQFGRQNWSSVIPNANITRTGVGTLHTNGLGKEFSYTANLGGVQIFFDM